MTAGLTDRVDPGSSFRRGPCRIDFALLLLVLVAIFAPLACSERPGTWPSRTATPVQVGQIQPFSSASLDPGCGPACPSNIPTCNLLGSIALPPCVPIGRCINVPDETCAAVTGAAPHFCWISIPQATDYTIIVEEVGLPRRTVWSWTFQFQSATATTIGAEYGNSCGASVPAGEALVPGRQYQWGVAARVDSQLFALGGPWNFRP